jgi:hypothetical protein
MTIPLPPIPSGMNISSTLGLNDGVNLNNIYTVEHQNWYKTLPYGFTFYDRSTRSGRPGLTFYLPIGPENIQVTTHMATNVVTTLYGVIEEHSDVRYYDMVISGSTGFAPRYVNVKVGANGTNNSIPSPLTAFRSNGRRSFMGSENWSVVQNITDTPVGSTLTAAVQDISQTGFSANRFTHPQIRENVGEIIQPPSTLDDSTSIMVTESGYAAFHNFYRFLMKYKKDAAGVGDLGNRPRQRLFSAPLVFLNYKDNIKYDCVPQSFTLVRSAEDPMMYKYTIRMRCYNMRNVSAFVEESGRLQRLGIADDVDTIRENELFDTFSRNVRLAERTYRTTQNILRNRRRR